MRNSHFYIITVCINVHCVLHAYFRDADKEWEDYNGRTPLLTAAAFGKTEAVIKLIEYGADVEAVDNNDRNVVHFIVSQGHVNMLKVRKIYKTILLMFIV